MLKEQSQYNWTNNKGFFRCNLVSDYLEPIQNKYIEGNYNLIDCQEDKDYIEKLLLTMSQYYKNYHNKSIKNSYNIDFLHVYSLAVSYYSVITFHLGEYELATKLAISSYETCPTPDNDWIVLLDEIITKCNSKQNIVSHKTLIDMLKESGPNEFEDCVEQAQKLAAYFLK